jgi:hypothetical protein
MEFDIDQDSKNLESLKKELIRMKDITSVYENMIEKIEVFKKKLNSLKDTILKSQFYQDVNCKEDLLELLDNIQVEKVSNTGIMFFVKSKSNREKRVLFRCDWEFQFDVGSEDITFKIESPDYEKPKELSKGYGDLSLILDYQIKPIEYLTVIMAVFHLFDTRNIINGYELDLSQPKDITHLNRNMYFICHTRNAKKNNNKNKKRPISEITHFKT